MKNQKGFGLVQVLVTVAIMGIVLTAVATMMVTQMQETKAMTEKLAALDVQRNLSSLLSAPGVCSYNLSVLNLPPYDFAAGDGTAARPFPPIALGNTFLNSVASPTNPTPAAAYRVTPAADRLTAPFPASVASPLVLIQSIRLTIQCVAPPCNYSTATSVPANIEFVYFTEGLVRSLPPSRASVTLNLNGSGSVKTITGCAGAGVSGVNPPDTPGEPCTYSGESSPRGFVVYQYTGNTKWCCMADGTNLNISQGAYGSGYATLVLACKGIP